MKLKQLFLGSLIFLFTVSTIGVLCPTADLASPSQLDDQTRSQVLAATIQIAMYEHVTDGAGYEAGGISLGTLVTHSGQTFILTHDHWNHLNANLNEVELRDASGKLLLMLDAASFTGLIRYRDGGTMLVQAPAALGGLVPARPAYAPALRSGETAWLARRSTVDGGASVEVVPARVEALEATGTPARLRLNTVNGQIVVPGDSGGGVWLDGELLGNLWAARLLPEENYFWTRLLDGGNEQAMDLIIAARQPLTEQEEGQGQASKAHEPAVIDFERGPGRPER